MVSKPRTGIPGVPGLSKVVNESAHGEAMATKRYGGGTRTFPPPEDRCYPQALGDPKTNLQGKLNDVPENSWLRGGPKESAEGKPAFDFNRSDGAPVGGNRNTPGTHVQGSKGKR